MFQQIFDLCDTLIFPLENIHIHETYLDHDSFYYYKTRKNNKIKESRENKIFKKKLSNYMKEIEDVTNLVIYEMYIKEFIIGKVKNKNIFFILCEKKILDFLIICVN